MRKNRWRTGPVLVLATLLAALWPAWAADGDALVEATYQGDLDEISRLIDGGTDVDARNESGSTALVLAASFRGYEDVVELLVDRGADVNAVDAGGRTPLMSAASVSKKGTGLLLSKGADVTARDGDGSSVLMHCVMGHLEGRDRVDVMDSLIEGGADVNDALPSGTTVLMIAVRVGDLDLVKFLVSKGAKTELARKDGKTALAIAEKDGHAEIAAFLKENEQ